MRVTVLDHPLVAHKLTVLRDKNTTSPVFRLLVEELVTLLAYEATRGVRVEPVEIDTPVTRTAGVGLSKPRPLVVPILRAGLGMLEGMTRLVPTAEVGFLGMARNEDTLDIITYAERLPADPPPNHAANLESLPWMRKSASGIDVSPCGCWPQLNMNQALPNGILRTPTKAALTPRWPSLEPGAASPAATPGDSRGRGPGSTRAPKEQPPPESLRQKDRAGSKVVWKVPRASARGRRRGNLVREGKLSGTKGQTGVRCGFRPLGNGRQGREP